MATSTSGSGGDLRLGELLVREGLISEPQLAAALRWKQDHEGYVPLGQVLVQQKALTRQKLNQVLDTHQRRAKLGDALVRSGAITPEQLEHALTQQKTTKERLGQLLVKLNYVTEDVLRKAISQQLDIPYMDLDRLTIDRAQFIELLKAQNIGCSVHFIPLHLHPFYRDTYGYAPDDFPVARATYERVVSLPLHTRMTDADAADVIDAVRGTIAQYRR
jgi:dTDP-4-amino-4,6-dideoxygalactose transaminase